jgi:hypothetical protein
MTLNLSPIRFVDTGLCTRIESLLIRHSLNDVSLHKKLKDVTSLIKANPRSLLFKTKVHEVLQKIEKNLLKKSNYNLVIRNIPKMAISFDKRELVFVTCASIRDTMKQFGDVSSLSMKYGVAYIEITNNLYTHNTLNKMQLGENIITTEVV